MIIEGEKGKGIEGGGVLGGGEVVVRLWEGRVSIG